MHTPAAAFWRSPAPPPRAACCPGAARCSRRRTSPHPASGPTRPGDGQVWCRSATQTGLTSTRPPLQRGAGQLTRSSSPPVPDGQYVTKLATAIRGRSVPDLVDFDDINSQLFIYRDAFTDLTDADRGAAVRRAAQPRPPAAWPRARTATTACPTSADNSLLFCNKELFERAGLDPDESTDGPSTACSTRAKRIRALGRRRHAADSFAGNCPGCARLPLMQPTSGRRTPT